MTRARIVAAGLVAVAGIPLLLTYAPVHAQAPARDTSDSAVTALVSEVRALRADLAASSRNQLRAQMLLGRVQMQEQRLAYLDKQRGEVSNLIALQTQMTSAFGPRNQDSDGACSKMPSPAEVRACEVNVVEMRRQFAAQQAREQQLRAQENELTNALAAEQARWSDFNSRLDELEQALR